MRWDVQAAAPPGSLGSGDECKSQAHGGASGRRRLQTSSEPLANSPSQPARPPLYREEIRDLRRSEH